MSTNPQSIQSRTETTPTAPTPGSEPPTRQRPAWKGAPRTFEPTNTGKLPPMFEAEADHEKR
ncbi:hypothetical protein [Halapricum hydrolyticum]|uniref:Uncharacterized protein n=1 Tax=Halapricum hydrolyticum TaxID=2979991 RepID=A0AAE3LEG5_9EURY|nr:hypothetical protein [Halapricum hydrolyticum]MCU4717044.1 hypothetical protein [Halapricum hydrolyticum]MCU4725970.1 hypothetical protein [Halapricum hydrolyticum]